jgi:hypothetical protein
VIDDGENIQDIYASVAVHVSALRLTDITDTVSVTVDLVRIVVVRAVVLLTRIGLISRISVSIAIRVRAGVAGIA